MRAALLVAVLTGLAVTTPLLDGTLAPGRSHAAVRAGGPVNIILVTTDDQTMNSFTPRAMPHAIELARKGTAFTRSFAVPPLCCPARAGWITGQYPHHHGVFDNRPGYPDLADPENVLPAWLGRAGYTTGFFGKYLNGVADTLGGAPAPGWDRWFALAGGVDYFRPEISVDGEVRRFDRYVTPLLADRAAEFIRDAARQPAPFFAWVSNPAPHGQSGVSSAQCPNPAPPVRDQDYAPFADAPLPKSPAFDERDVSDKPLKIRSLPRLRPHMVDRLRQRHRCELAAMSAVDDGLGQLIRTVERRGLSRETAIIFTDDNGYMTGQHRIFRGKSKIYEGSLRVPLAMRVPRAAIGGSAESRIEEPVGGIDLAPTFLDFAGGVSPCAAPDCRIMDGRSLTGLLQGDDSQWPTDRGLLIEVGGRCRQRAIRTARYLYARTAADCHPRDLELYDLKQDPFELRNLRRSDESLQKELEVRLGDLLGCAGIADRDPPPGGSAAYCE